jgi:Uma2 family endonuclease
MVVMDVPRTGHRAAAQAADVDDPLAELEELFWTLDLGPRHRVELLEGRIVVSPEAAFWHEVVATWLIYQFKPVCDANGWEQAPGADLILRPTREIIEPDHIVVKDPEAFSNAKSVVPIDHVLLVSEICSPSSIRTDREVKPVSCARAGIPFYLLVDRFTEPLTITLFAEPGKDGYGKAERVTGEPGGGKLAVPEPFGVTIDASTLPQIRAGKLFGRPSQGGAVGLPRADGAAGAG